MNEWSFFCAKWLNPWWQSSRWLPSSSWVRINEFESDWTSLSQSFVQNGWIQDGCHHQGRSDWISLSQSHGERVFLSESQKRKQSVWIQDGRMQDGCHHQVESEWISEVFFVQMVGSNLGKCEWVWEEIIRWLNPRWQISRWQNSRWLPSSSWMRMNEFESDWISLSHSQNGVRVFLIESERR